MRYLGLLLVFGLTLYALIDCIRTDDSEVKGLPKVLWMVVIVLIGLIGPIAWLVAGRDRRFRPPPRAATAGPVAPDDDPAFLREIDLERRRRAERERREKERRDRRHPDEGSTA